MPDRDGTTIAPGDPVILYRGDTDFCATVLRDLGNNRYLVRLDPRKPARDAGHLAQHDQLDALARDHGIDTEEPLDEEVDGSQLEFLGFWGDEDEDEVDDPQL
jgi:hypothetical protein